MYSDLKARSSKFNPVETLREKFSSLISETAICDAIYSDAAFKNVVGIAGLPFTAPVVLELIKDGNVAKEISSLIKSKNSLLILLNKKNSFSSYLSENGKVSSIELSFEVKNKIEKILRELPEWAGKINSIGEHIIKLKNPSPGPHFYVNLLLGNRIGFPYPLQSTPKSVVDHLGRGSFRSHADFQVLATRWDFRQEENGFPANRQFYLVEDGKKIFYSGDVNDPNFEDGYCIHSQNLTTIFVKTKCGLIIERNIFILPQYEGLPLATEVQRIKIYNKSNRPRNLKIITVGMFGSSAPHALMEDVIYSNIIMQSRLLKDKNDNIIAIGVDYYPVHLRNDERFFSMIIRDKSENKFPAEFCSNYNEFVGRGTLENPEGLYILSNKIYRKGPGFFALGGYVDIEIDNHIIVDTFTGVVSNKANPSYSESSYYTEIHNLLEKFSTPDSIEKAIEDNRNFYTKYSSFLKIHTFDNDFNTYFNNNLPYQILYQTFVSRSFCQTQKGYREIGFREIQDLYASMYYFVSMNRADFVKELLLEWASMVFEAGYAYHNFFWRGKEAGKWSDDALWFIQAVYRYVSLTGDVDFLKEEAPIAGTENKKRPIFQTIEAIINYSAVISVGGHGLPLLDRADWNDCLRIDVDFLDGPAKEKIYKESGKNNTLKNYSESVMNAFLLKIAIDEYSELALLMKNTKAQNYTKELSAQIYKRIQQNAWKEDFFARVLLNNKNGLTYIGAKGDSFSLDPNLEGSYFINSYSWAILSGVATEEQIKIMTETLEKALKNPFGIKLMTQADLGKVSNVTASSEYFPGDRENGAIFKHASMMMVYAMLKAAKTLNDKNLAKRLAKLAYWMIDIVLPYKTMKNPFFSAGNPRFCTQYINSETGEHIGPLLSGTATWLNLSIIFAMGIDFSIEGIKFDPILKPEEKEISYILNTGRAIYNVTIQKPEGFYRIKEGNYKLILDKKDEIKENILPLFSDGKEHYVLLTFY
ncbi:MAG: GH36-type glycosyl hydrolase domain-containing protein [Brevinematia bacterium]